MNDTLASSSAARAQAFRSRTVERLVRGQPTSDGDGVKLVRVLTLGPDFVPQALPLQKQPEATLAAGESRLFRLAAPGP